MSTGSGAEPRYRFESRIATGGMGEVWRATDTVLGREVAVKVLKHEYADDPEFRSRFSSEARHAASLHHPGVASVFDAGELPDDDGSGHPRPYLVMELVPGQPLSALLRGGEAMPADTASDLIAQAADAVAAAHAMGIVHRDIKPGNLLVTPQGQVKITDFGIARAADVAGITQTGQVLGTPAYLAPEQAEGREATAASDVYALGVVLYECLAGQRPFVRDSAVSTALAHLRDDPPPLPAGVPDQLRRVVVTALAKDPVAAVRVDGRDGRRAARRPGHRGGSSSSRGRGGRCSRGGGPGRLDPCAGCGGSRDRSGRDVLVRPRCAARSTASTAGLAAVGRGRDRRAPRGAAGLSARRGGGRACLGGHQPRRDGRDHAPGRGDAGGRGPQ